MTRLESIPTEYGHRAEDGVAPPLNRVVWHNQRSQAWHSTAALISDPELWSHIPAAIQEAHHE